VGKLLFFSIVFLTSCIHPKVGIRKAYLLDPTMDTAQAQPFGELMTGAVHGSFEKAVVGGGGAGGGSCPTCK
jgi:hypothetical protein